MCTLWAQERLVQGACTKEFVCLQRWAALLLCWVLGRALSPRVEDPQGWAFHLTRQTQPHPVFSFPSRADWIGKEPEPYRPTFSDGWQLPEPSFQVRGIQHGAQPRQSPGLWLVAAASQSNHGHGMTKQWEGSCGCLHLSGEVGKQVAGSRGGNRLWAVGY